MMSDLQTQPVKSNQATVPPATRLVEAFGLWEAARRATRTRRQLCYALCSVILAIVLTLVLYSTFVYLWKLMSTQPPSAAELSALRHFIINRSAIIIGTAVLLCAISGLIHAVWIRNHHEHAVLDVRNEAEKCGWSEGLRACGGKLDERRGQSEWQTFQQYNRGFVIGYSVAAALGAVLTIIAYWSR